MSLSKNQINHIIRTGSNMIIEAYNSTVETFDEWEKNQESKSEKEILKCKTKPK